MVRDRLEVAGDDSVRVRDDAVDAGEGATLHRAEDSAVPVEFDVIAHHLRRGLTFVLIGLIAVRPLRSEAPVARLVPDDRHVLAVDVGGLGQEEVLGALELDLDRASDRCLAGARTLTGERPTEVEVADEVVGNLGEDEAALGHIRSAVPIVVQASAAGAGQVVGRIGTAPHRKREGHGQREKQVLHGMSPTLPRPQGAGSQRTQGSHHGHLTSPLGSIFAILSS